MPNNWKDFRNCNELLTFQQFYYQGVTILENANVPNSRNNCWWLMEHGLEMNRQQLICRFSEKLSFDQQCRLFKLFKRRTQREPLQYITGFTEFYGLKIKCDSRALIPRPETEILVELTLKYLNELDLTKLPNLRITEIGTGSGCIAAAIATELIQGLINSDNFEFTIQALEINSETAQLANENFKNLNLQPYIQVIQGDLFNPPPQLFKNADLLIANLPYIDPADFKFLAREVTAEPKIALFSGQPGAHGLNHLKYLIQNCSRFVKPGGRIFLECGKNQIHQLINDQDFAENWRKSWIVHSDLNQIERFLELGGIKCPV